MLIRFEHSVAGVYCIDESAEVTTNYSAISSAFDNSDPTWHGCNMSIEDDSPRIELYGDLGKVNYASLNSYCMVGQDAYEPAFRINFSSSSRSRNVAMH
jgi:hypothetical protein